MNEIRDNWIFISFLLFLFSLLYQKIFWIALISILLLWIFKTKDYSWMLLCLLMLIVIIPRYSTSIPTMKEGKATTVKGSYAILSNANEKIIVYTNEPLQYDAIYTIHGELQEITSSSHFYRFDYLDWCHKQGVYYFVDKEDIQLIRNTFSIRSLLQYRIEKIQDNDKKAMLYKSLLNISVKDTDETKWYYQNGFTYTGMLIIIDIVLKKLLTKKKRNIVLILLTIVLLFVYHFPLLLVESLLFRLFSYTKLSYKQKTGCVASILILLYPQENLSLTFLLPMLYRYSFLFRDKSGTFFVSLLIQSYLFQAINPLKSLMYRNFMKLYGLLFITSLVDVFFMTDFTKVIDFVLTQMNLLIDIFYIKGSIVGVGLLFFILLVFSMRKQKYFYMKCMILLTVFLTFGLFHPCAELSIINVGQGDAILLRAPLNQTNILIDTGKESAYASLKTFLNAKEIQTIDTMIITHPDDDHNGNVSNLQKDFNIKNMILTHNEEYDIGSFHLYDLNKISNEDENASSIVNVFNFNQKQVCLMGDSDQDSEESIIYENPSLHCDILKLSHHGSKTGSSDKFLDTTKPGIALISSGSYKLYHHPSEEVIQKLLKRHIAYLDTKTSGDITIFSFFSINILITSQFEIALI